ncbi:ESPR-type extended signal peptide-containing protein [Ralstonia sp. A12]|uniref:ESPR-type extended signal peptide-containing protein n=1 Tax=Ralstonia sp. A12 TaxID=1217052 RepID=UPI00057CC8B2|nr:ESPR-type extended signal peptide-containing protein [Ralstonia sp. A12]
MNKVYRSVWNATTNTWAAAAETAKSRSKGTARAARRTVVALALGGAAMGGAFAAEECTTEDGRKGTTDTAGVCTPASIGTMGTSAIGTSGIGTNAALDDTYIKITNSGGTASVNNSASGIAIGPSATVGSPTIRTGNGLAIGQGAQSLGTYGSMALGGGTLSSGVGSVAIGTGQSGKYGATASADGAIAIGGATSTLTYAQATGAGAVSVGIASKASQQGATALGRQSEASAENAVALGSEAKATGTSATALGNLANAAANAVAIGASANAGTVAGNIAVGNLANASGARSIATGVNAEASGANSIALGSTDNDAFRARATGSNAIAMGVNARGTADNGIAVGQNADVQATATGSVALGSGSIASAANTVSIGNTTTQRKLVNMAAGTQATDAVNVSQLTPVVTALGGGASIDPNTGAVTGPTYNLTNGGPQTTVGGALAALDNGLSTANGNITQNTTDITNIRNGLNNGTIGLVQQDATTKDISVAAATGGNKVDFTGTDGVRTLTGLANGNVAAGSTDAVTGDQLNTTNVNVANLDGRVTKNEGDITTINTNVTNLDGRVTTAEGNITQNTTDITNIRNGLNNGTIGLVQQDATTKDISVAAATGGDKVDFTGTDGVRTLTGLANGNLAAGSTDAVTGDQLNTTNVNVANLDGRVTVAEGNITQNTTDITNIRNGLSNGTIGLVQQDATTKDISVAAATGGDKVDFTGTDGVRTLTGLANGNVAAGSTDAVTGDQLNTTNVNVANLDGRVTKNEGDITTINTNVTNLDGRVTVAEGDIIDIRSQLGNGSIGLVQQDATTKDISVAAATGGDKVDFTGTDGVRKLTGLANGNVAAGSTDAVTGDQLNTTNVNVANLDGRVTKNEGDITTINTNVTNLDGRVTVAEGDITDIRSQLGNGTIGLVQQDATTKDITVAAATGGDKVDFTGTDGVRTLTGVANGAVSATSQDAINGSQLHGVADSVASAIGAGSTVNPDGSISAPSFTVGDGNGGTTIVHNVGDAVTNLDGRTTTNETNITNLQQQVGNGTIGLVQQNATTKDITVAAATGGDKVDFTGTDGVRTLTGVANGAVSATSQDAINGSQLHGVADSVASAIGAGSTVNPDGSISAPSFTVGDGKGGTTIVHNVGDAVTNLDGRTTTNETNITQNTTDITNLQQQVGNGTIGLVQQAGAGADLTVGAATDGANVNFAGTAGDRKLVGVANGDVSATSKEAINGSQLHGVSQSVADAIGAGSSVNPDGSITQPSFTVGDGNGGTTIVHNVGDAVTNLDGRTTVNETNITNLQQQVGNGTIGLVQQNATTKDITVAAATGGDKVDFTGTDGARKLTGIANGDVAAGSTDAVTGDQLNTTNVNVANLDGRVTKNEGDITNIRNDLSNGSIGLVQQAGPNADVTVAAATGGTVVNFAGTAGDRRLNGVANGVADNDAASIAQLKAMGLFDPNTNLPMAAVVYDDITLSSVTFGGTGGTVLNNVAPGLIASGSMQAVNGGQLFDLEQKVGNYYSYLDGRVTNLEQNGGGSGGGSGGPADFSGSGMDSTQVGKGADASGDYSSAVGQGAVASGSNSSAIGQGSSASGSNSSAIGQGANASADNAVALGQGSVADREGTVSVGSAGAERQITNVAAGTAPTDAVNVQQMNNSVRSARQDAMGGVAAAMAVAGLPQSSMPGRTFMAISGSTYGGEYGTAVGASYMTRDGKWTVKAAINTSSRGEVGAVVGGGFYW